MNTTPYTREFKVEAVGQVVQSEEVRRLMVEFPRVTLERDVLKKAATYFAKQSG